MTKIRFAFQLVAVLAFTLACFSFAQAQACRTWVSGVGDDLNPCSRTAPCKTFAGAFSKTAAGGEIDTLDSGGYGTLTISKSITIDGNGTIASVLATGTTGFTINVAATDTVILRHLSISGACATSINGINWINAGGTVILEDLEIEKFGNNLVKANLTASGNLHINNLRGQNSAGLVIDNDAGIYMKTTSGTLRAVIDNVHLQNNVIGINAEDNTQVTVRNSVISGNGANNTVGVRVAPDGATPAVMTLEGVTISHNSQGVRTTQAGGAVATFLSNCNINNAANAGSNAGAGVTVTSFTNNTFAKNAVDHAGPYTAVLQQ
jgi:hypothetical protein